MKKPAASHLHLRLHVHGMADQTIICTLTGWWTCQVIDGRRFLAPSRDAQETFFRISDATATPKGHYNTWRSSRCVASSGSIDG